MTGLADCNNFFVSCQRSVNPDLEGRAVIVGSNNDGCVVARSNEAKQLGIKMGQPIFELRDLIRSQKVIAISGHHLLYKEISIKVHEIMRRYAPSTIDYSVDEAFLDMSGIPINVLPEIGRNIVETCKREVRIPITVGFAPTKTLAKVITEISKKRGENVALLHGEENINRVLSQFPINDLWGIGRKLAKRMYLEGIHTAADFASKDLMWVRSKFGVNGQRSWLELHSEPCLTLEHVNRPIQDSISESRSFPFDVDEYDYIRARIAMYTGHCAKRLRSMHALCKQLTVTLQTNRFHTDYVNKSAEISVVFDTPVCDTHTLVGAALEGLQQIFNPAYKYKRAGIILTEIQPGEQHTPSLFSAAENNRLTKLRKLSKVIDKLNKGDDPVILPLAAEISNGYPGHNDGYSSTFQFRK